MKGHMFNSKFVYKLEVKRCESKRKFELTKMSFSERFIIYSYDHVKHDKEDKAEL